MSVRIRASYKEEKELQGILRILKPFIKKFKIAKDQKGDHKNAYIELKNIS